MRIGIDLGTTNSLGALVYDDGPHIIPRGRGEIVPSAVLFEEKPSAKAPPKVGTEASNNPARAVRSIKRLMGRTWDEAVCEGSERYFSIDGHCVRLVRRGESALGLEVEIKGEWHCFWPHEISAYVLHWVKVEAERHLGQAVDSAVITVPAYFKDSHRKATLDAARKAGLRLAGGDLLDEPTAAALAFAPNVGFEPGESVLVADWGGGTLDFTVLLSDGNRWMQLAIEGDLTLGGDDIDLELAKWILRQAKPEARLLEDERNAWRLRETAREIKERLSQSDEAMLHFIPLGVGGRKLSPLVGRVRRADLDPLLQPLLARAETVLERCLSHEGVDRDAIRKVLLVGGSSRLPAFRGLLRRVLPKADLREDVNPMLAVALGAALFANSPPAIARISPFGYAVVADDKSEPTPVIPPDTDVPTPEAARFMVPAETRYTGQTVYRMTFVEFEKRGAGRLAWGKRQRLFARGMPPRPASTRVDVEVWLDEHKTLQAACHLAGVDDPLPMQGREEGPDELFTRLDDSLLDSEALVEANREERTGLIPALAALVSRGKNAVATGDRVAAEALVGECGELKVQVTTAQNRIKSDERARILNWVRSYEKTALPRFGNAMSAESRTAALEAIRIIRAHEQTAATVDVIRPHFSVLSDALFDGDSGVLLSAFHWSEVIGVPERLQINLREGALRARDIKVAGGRGYAAEAQALQQLIDEAKRAWETWSATGKIRNVQPDLHLINTQAGGN